MQHVGKLPAVVLQSLYRLAKNVVDFAARHYVGKANRISSYKQHRLKKCISNRSRFETFINKLMFFYLYDLDYGEKMDMARMPSLNY